MAPSRLRHLNRRSVRLVTGLAFCLATASCTPAPKEEDGPDLTRLVPVTGRITLNGKPAAGVVVTFLPPQWGASNGETKDDGSYSLTTAGRPGALPGSYRVAVSYLVDPAGRPQGLSARSSMTPVPSLAQAKERIPAEFSDLGRTTLDATVPAVGGSFNFDVKADLEPTAPAPAEPKGADSGTRNDAAAAPK
jgi:hypothetical protein